MELILLSAITILLLVISYQISTRRWEVYDAYQPVMQQTREIMLEHSGKNGL